MEKPLPGTSPTYSKVEDVVHNLVFEVGLKIAINSIIASNAWLGLPVIRQVLEYVAEYIVARAYGSAELMIAFQVIDSQIEGQRTRYEETVVKLKDAIEKGDQNAKELAVAKEEFKRRLRDLVQLPHP